MFTGIVTHIGRVVEREGGSDALFTIESGLDLDAIGIGASVCHAGVCLTLVEKSANRHRVLASAETLARTNLGQWQPGTAVNLERSLRVGDEIGGHYVFGHVDGLARITGIDRSGQSHRLSVRIPDALRGLVAKKGSVTLDGISLTINGITGGGITGDEITAPEITGDEITAGEISLMIIPHTWQATTLQDRKIGDRLHIEADMLARYVARQLETGRG